jgi:hypothetical protein
LPLGNWIDGGFLSYWISVFLDTGRIEDDGFSGFGFKNGFSGFREK